MWTEHEDDHSAPSSAEVMKNGGAIPPLPHMYSWHVKGRGKGMFLN